MKWTTPFLIITFAPTIYASFTMKVPSEFAVTLTETPALELKDEAALRPVVVARVSKRMYCFKVSASRVWFWRTESVGTKIVTLGEPDHDSSRPAFCREFANAVPLFC